MTRICLRRLGAAATAVVAIAFSPQTLATQLPMAVAQAPGPGLVAPAVGPPGFALTQPVAGSPTGLAPRVAAPSNASYTHTPAPNPGNDLPPGSGPIMPSTTLYYDFWLPTGQHYESHSA